MSDVSDLLESIINDIEKDRDEEFIQENPLGKEALDFCRKAQEILDKTGNAPMLDYVNLLAGAQAMTNTCNKLISMIIQNIINYDEKHGNNTSDRTT